ncbi:PREDICTED: ubiquitin-conjugating enzyme E2 T-like [Dufourea novaeangliae]|uniref:Ubiquitin-conjugating enzyme E2 T n=1 Tax=Dufourea novaeangliae TaxID=178035 RepID=A0A154PBU8_DUFNO|nr:PREDICTED: ubiquitin-conjugating enzyme E2 T-like [Dufourea novaeangliae]KZC09366.1 Ubiquitin-conjugating enzyme E2 T [Dufourea novaeangliae]
MQRSIRLKRELERLKQNPMDGICCYPKSDNCENLVATIIGPHGSAYIGAIFELEIDIPEQYPFEPPRVTFKTPVYHPNIDNNGRICMDLLNMPPKGSWKPTISLQNLLDAVQCLLGNPNPDDPLMADIAQEYKFNKVEFERKVRKFIEETKTKHL